MQNPHIIHMYACTDLKKHQTPFAILIRAAEKIDWIKTKTRDNTQKWHFVNTEKQKSRELKLFIKQINGIYANRWCAWIIELNIEVIANVIMWSTKSSK